jgi:cobalt-precorrin-5B (C1)-methyltransferase
MSGPVDGTGDDGVAADGTATDDAGRPLRRGWTTGACATAAAKSAFAALATGRFLDPVTIRLPKGETPSFPLAEQERAADWARAGVVKDAGDDPDVTHGCLVQATVRRGRVGAGVGFHAGPGVGTVTKPGLPLPPGEPAINPAPRAMIRAALEEVAAETGVAADLEVEISIPGGEALAARTWNGRLGIVGGLSILGTTGIVVPYSCSAWIHSIHRGIDVARATGQRRVVGTTGDTSEAAARRLYTLPDEAYLDMGDFAGGLLKYLRRHPVPHLTLAGGFAKLSKLADGALDLHSKRSQVDRRALADRLAMLGAAPEIVASAAGANTALEILQIAERHGLPLAKVIADDARRVALDTLAGSGIAVDVLVVDRQGHVVARTTEGG